MNKEQLKKYNNKTASAEEKRAVETWYETVNGAEAAHTADEAAQLKEVIFNRVKSKIEAEKEVPVLKNRLRISTAFLAKAAVLLLVFSVGAFFYLHKNKPVSFASFIKTKKSTIKPGDNNAVLTLADGSTVILNEVANGQIGQQSGASITKTKSGELVYSFAANTNAKTTAINTISTPKGGQYHLILTDGTNVWLNANSSIKFPAAFTGDNRQVEITGEVYFEVFKNKAKPFIVNTSQSEIKVLGTHFNVNAYDDEAFEKTTLLEGAIELKRGADKALLTPGLQASLSKSSSHIAIKEVDDLDAIIAWKNGYFQFDRADLQSVMRQVSRWYNVSVSYKGPILNKEYSGKIPRKTTAEKLIEMLHYSGINCTIENNQITVKP
ncbi:FecR family protein [Pedobacter sp. KR3-3]|uniref:FecR family protein n=1 Tax=Pedobacter albus TaxID=3113905 RepID=A0ABU7I4H6_9SPHI|nr:FecR family protein [Pedobacter sp. KR3-3]MEE1944231.1 FecR family protein [Pedobacter sp. KR3-3]